MASTAAGRRIIANDTLARTTSIITWTPEASAESAFYSDANCPPLDNFPPLQPLHGPSRVIVINSDSFTAARALIRSDPTAARKVIVLNHGSDKLPGGGWRESLSRTQEEALCYSSTLYYTLRSEWYPWPNLGVGSVAGIFSPSVVVFKDDLDHNCVDLPIEERIVVSVVTVSAPCWPALTPDSQAFLYEQDVDSLRGKIRLILRIAAHSGRDRLILGAMGCGAYGCPPQFVANEMKSILLDQEFKGRFKDVIFAIYSSGLNGSNNFQIFSDIFENLVINS